ncbi:MAG: ATP-dependent RecD-like DNA helicase [Vicinamibacteria bacterium]|jgi:exodeoxyribonuclease V alpha subunit|nr:ATP-dependent RecD-like DNA helicase [Vicinamibacteria bacterium]
MPRRSMFNDDAPAKRDDVENVSGTIERVTFHNPDNGFCVLRVRIRGRRELATVVGHVAVILSGEYIQATGRWQHDREHGLQFRADFVRTAAPTSKEGIEKYLASGLIKGVGPVYAKKLVEAFGEKIFEIIDQEADRLLNVPGIGPARARQIIAGFASQRSVREIMIFLHSHGVGTARAVRIYKTYGPQAIRLITENPYRLARDIRGIGFLSADAIAGRLGIEKTAEMRLRAGVLHVLASALDDGHCGLPIAELTKQAIDLLSVEKELIARAIANEREAGELVEMHLDGQPCAFLLALARAEQIIASRLHALLQGALPWPTIDTERALPWIEAKTHLELSVSQREALRLALRSKVLVLTGGPGVGKTTLLRSLLTILLAKGVRTLLAAPTGRAAKRLTESTGCEAKTIHRLLEVDPVKGVFRHHENHPVRADLVVIDETSMVDVPLMSALLRAIPDRAALVLVGDVDQLPSVGPGQVLADIISSGVLPVVRLTEVFRQAAESRIITSAHRVNHGLLPEPPPEGASSDFYVVKIDDPQEGAARLIEIVKERIPQRFGLNPIHDIQVLCPMNRGVLGAHALNMELQKALNPAREPNVTRFGFTYSLGDRVMQIENDYEKDVFNGDLGRVNAIDEDASELAVDFDGRIVVYGFDELDSLALAYAISIHKSQGSEYPAVVIPIAMQHYMMLRRNLIYTGMTRGKRLCVILAQTKALTIAVKAGQESHRYSKLKDLLIEKPAAIV